MLIAHLPAGNALALAQSNDAHWSLTDHLLAVIADGINAQIWQLGSGKKADYPKPIPRPGVSAGERLGSSVPLADIDAIIEKAYGAVRDGD